MLDQLIAFAGIALVFGAAFLMMGAMWRRMRRVNAHTAAESRRRAERVDAPPLERWDAGQGRYVPVDGDPNEELLRQGARGHARPWPYDP